MIHCWFMDPKSKRLFGWVYKNKYNPFKTCENNNKNERLFYRLNYTNDSCAHARTPLEQQPKRDKFLIIWMAWRWNGRPALNKIKNRYITLRMIPNSCPIPKAQLIFIHSLTSSSLSSFPITREAKYNIAVNQMRYLLFRLF